MIFGCYMRLHHSTARYAITHDACILALVFNVKYVLRKDIITPKQNIFMVPPVGNNPAGSWLHVIKVEILEKTRILNFWEFPHFDFFGKDVFSLPNLNFSQLPVGKLVVVNRLHQEIFVWMIYACVEHILHLKLAQGYMHHVWTRSGWY